MINNSAINAVAINGSPPAIVVVSSKETAPIAIGFSEGQAGRIDPSTFSAPAGTYVFCLGHEVGGIFGQISHGDYLSITQNADFDDTHVFRFRARIRSPRVIPTSVLVSAVATGTYSVTVNGEVYSYDADTTGKDFTSGAAATINDAEGDLMTITGLSGMSADSVGRRLVVSGASTAANNGTFPIREFVDSTSVRILNAAGVAGDANNGSISWIDRRRPDNETTIAIALRDLVNNDPSVVAKVNAADGIVSIESVDEDDDLVVSVAGNLTKFTWTWRASMSIDGTVRWSEDFFPARNPKDPIDGGAEISQSVGAGAVDLVFKLELISSIASGSAELEIPAFHVDALSFDTVS